MASCPKEDDSPDFLFDSIKNSKLEKLMIRPDGDLSPENYFESLPGTKDFVADRFINIENCNNSDKILLMSPLEINHNKASGCEYNLTPEKCGVGLGISGGNYLNK